MLRTSSVIFISVLMLSGCVQQHDKPVDKSANDKKEKTGIGALDKFVDNMEEMQKKMDESKEVEVVDFRELKVLIPDEIAGMKKTNSSGEKNSSFGFTVSHAVSDFSNEDGSASLTVEISDMGGMSGISGLAAYAWAFTDIDSENDDGYEKTISYKGHKGFEKYINSSQSGNIDVLVVDRYLVQVSGYNVSIDIIKGVLEEIDISQLEKMRDAGLVSK